MVLRSIFYVVVSFYCVCKIKHVHLLAWRSNLLLDKTYDILLIGGI